MINEANLHGLKHLQVFDRTLFWTADHLTVKPPTTQETATQKDADITVYQYLERNFIAQLQCRESQDRTKSHMYSLWDLGCIAKRSHIQEITRTTVVFPRTHPKHKHTHLYIHTYSTILRTLTLKMEAIFTPETSALTTFAR
jgi:hypothetical protein